MKNFILFLYFIFLTLFFISCDNKINLQDKFSINHLQQPASECSINNFKINNYVLNIGNNYTIEQGDISLEFEKNENYTDPIKLALYINGQKISELDELSIFTLNEEVIKQLDFLSQGTVTLSDIDSPECTFSKTINFVCPSGKYYIQEANTCDECSILTVYDPQNFECKHCEYPQLYMNDSKTCDICFPPTVYDSSSYKCVACSAPMVYLGETNSCGTCVAPTVYNSSTHKCEACSAPMVYLGETNSCGICVAPTVYDSSSYKCEACEFPEVFIGAKNSCESCPAGTIYNESKYECVSYCPDYSNVAMNFYNNISLSVPITGFMGGDDFFIKVEPAIEAIVFKYSPLSDNLNYSGFEVEEINSGVYSSSLLSQIPTGNYKISAWDANNCFIKSGDFSLMEGQSTETEISLIAYRSPINDMFNYNKLTDFIHESNTEVHDQHLPLRIDISKISQDQFDKILSAKIVVVMRWWDSSNTEGLVINGVFFGNPCFTISTCGGSNYIRNSWIDWNDKHHLDGALALSEINSGFDTRRFFDTHMWSKALRNAGLTGNSNAVCDRSDLNLCSFEFDLQEMLDDVKSDKSPNEGDTKIDVKHLLKAKDDTTIYINIADDTMVSHFELVLKLSE